MFFEVPMRRVVVVDPSELGDALHTKRAMIRRLVKDVEAERCSEELGYYVIVTTLEKVSEGRVRPDTGSVVFWVDFKCIVFRLIRNEIIDAEVIEVMHNGFFASTHTPFPSLAHILLFKNHSPSLQMFANRFSSSAFCTECLYITFFLTIVRQ